MNHPFLPSHTSADICGRCKFPRIAHTNEAECEACGNKAPVEIRYGNMLMCATCWSKEMELKNSPITAGSPITNEKAYNMQTQMLEEAKRIDHAIEVRSDIFNATTTSIMDIKKLIDENPEITNKPFTLAEQLLDRLTHFRKVGFELSEQLVENNNQQRAIQQYLNTLSNQLRAEEREKIKLKDINYNPSAIKPRAPKSISTTGTTPKKKLDKSLVKKYATELGISEFMLHTVAIGKGGDVEAAYKTIKASIEAAKSGVK